MEDLLKVFDNGNTSFYQFCNLYASHPEFKDLLEENLNKKTSDINLLKILKLYIQLKEFELKKDIFRLNQIETGNTYMIKELKHKKCFLFLYKGKSVLISDSEILSAEKFINSYFEERGQKVIISRTFDKKWIYIKLEKSYLLDALEIYDIDGNKFVLYDPKHLNKLLTI